MVKESREVLAALWFFGVGLHSVLGVGFPISAIANRPSYSSVMVITNVLWLPYRPSGFPIDFDFSLSFGCLPVSYNYSKKCEVWGRTWIEAAIR